MSGSERWARLDELLDQALDQPPESRAEWLERETAGDAELRAEVERLLELAVSDDERLSPSGALGGPLWQDVVTYLEGDEPPKRLAPGDRIASYDIVELIGTGGMGAVYRARDPNLNRDVAIKALSRDLREDETFLRRFEREGKLLASLNHPNIAAIYELVVTDDQPFLVLELVEGPTLADRLAEGPLELDEIVSIAHQISEALEEAHGKGIVHRDLKPGNVKLGANGRVKVLDFGVAKTISLENERAGSKEEPTPTPPTTASGTILGTASYMSPEQVRGKTVDKRADIWAFGCILFEMLTGRRPFSGKTTSDILASVLRDDAAWDALPESTPAGLVRLTRRSLEKDPRRRLQDIGDARIELEELRQGVSGSVRPAGARRATRTVSAPSALLLIGLVIGFAVAWLWFRSTSSDLSSRDAVSRTSIVIGPESRLWMGISPALALSPDGRTLAYIAGSGGQSRLFLRRLDRFDPDVVRSSEEARNPFFSPDGQWIGFFAGGSIKKVPTSGGNPDVVIDVGLQPRGATWTDTGQIIFAEAGAPGLFAVDANGGDSRRISETESERVQHLWPHALPNGAVVFTVRREDDGRTRESLAVLTVGTNSVRELRAGTQAYYVDSGHLVYVHDGTVEAMPFDGRRLEPTGPSASLDTLVNVYPGGAASLAVARLGAMAYVPPIDTSVRLDWIDERGRSTTLQVPRGTPSWPRASPDGTRLAVHVGVPGSRDIWILDLERPGSLRQLTHDGAEFPVWSPDGERLAYMTRRHRASGLYTVAADGSEPPRLLFESEITKVPLSWSPQGILAFYAIHGETKRDVLVVPVEEEAEPETFVATPANELAPVFSPDGRWLAYVSDETGRNEVYVRPYPPPGGVVMVSIDGGSEPVWSPDGSTLYYRHDDTIMAVPVIESARELELGSPELQFESELIPNSAGNPLYDAMPNSRGFITMRSPRGRSMDRVYFVSGFDEELGRRATR